MSYTVKQVAAMLGISAQTLRFYERYGIEAGKRDEESGYRNYSHAGVDELMSIRKYRNCGFTLADAAKAMKTEEPDDVADMLMRQHDELEKEMAYKRLVMQKLQTVAEQVRRRNEGIWMTQVEPLLCCRVLNQERKPDNHGFRALGYWAQWLPMAQWTLYVAPDFSQRFYGFSIEKESADVCGIERDESCFETGQQTCICRYVIWSAQSQELYDVVCPLLEQMRTEYGSPVAHVRVQTILNHASGDGVMSHGLIFYPIA